MITYKKYSFKDRNGEYKQLVFCCPDKEFDDQVREIFEEEHYKKAKRKKDMVVVDFGANVGSVFYYLKDYVKDYYAVEPEPHIFDCLTQNTKNYPQVHRYNYGIYAYDGTLPLRTNNQDSPPQILVGEGNYETYVKCKSFDSFIKETKLKHIDVLKIDVEGSEYIILSSDSFIKHASKIDFIIGEGHYTMFQPDFLPVILKEAGFKTTFLPIYNYLRTNTITDNNTGKVKSYDVPSQTLFIAKRIDSLKEKS